MKERPVFLSQLPGTTHSRADALPSLQDNHTPVHGMEYCFLPSAFLECAVKDPIKGKGAAGAAKEDPLSHVSKVIVGCLQGR